MAKKDKYVEDQGDGFVKILGGVTTYKLSFWRSEDPQATWEFFKESLQGKIETDLVQTWKLLTGKDVPKDKPKRETPKKIK